MPWSQNCSSPALHASHWRQESTKQPTPTISPTLNLPASTPALLTLPTISWPGTIGKIEPPHSSRTWWTSEWHTPQYKMSINTSGAPGSRRSIENGPSAVLADSAA